MICKTGKICAVQHFDYPNNVTFPVCIPLSFVPGTYPLLLHHHSGDATDFCQGVQRRMVFSGQSFRIFEIIFCVCFFLLLCVI